MEWAEAGRDLAGMPRGGRQQRATAQRNLSLLDSSSAVDFVWSEQDEAVARVAQIAVPRQAGRNSSDLSQET